MCATNAAREAALPYRVESVPFGARNAEHFSHEMASLPWSIFQFSGDTGDAPGWKRLVEFLNARLQHMEPVLTGREWLAGSVSVADILMADVLRLVDRWDGLAGHPGLLFEFQLRVSNHALCVGPAFYKTR